MKKFSFQNILLAILFIVVLSLFFKIDDLSSDGTIYMPNTDSGFLLIKTEYGSFPISITETKPIDDGTQLSLILINPLTTHFKDAQLFIEFESMHESVTMDLKPGSNAAKLKISRLERGDLIKIKLKLDQIYFK